MATIEFNAVRPNRSSQMLAPGVSRGFSLIKRCAILLLVISILSFLSQTTLGEILGDDDSSILISKIWHALLITFLVPATLFCLLTSKRMGLDEAVHSPVLAAGLLIVPIAVVQLPHPTSAHLLSVFVYIDATYICLRFAMIDLQLRASLPDMILQVMALPETLLLEARESYFTYWVGPKMIELQEQISNEAVGALSKMLKERRRGGRWTIWDLGLLGNEKATFISYVKDSFRILHWVCDILGRRRLIIFRGNLMVVDEFIEPMVTKEIYALIRREA